MKVLWSKICKNSSFVTIIKLLVILFLIAFMAMYKSFGYRPEFLLKKINGKITNVIQNSYYSTLSRGGTSSHECMSLYIDTFNSRIINNDRTLAGKFIAGENISLLIYKSNGDYNFAQATQGDTLILRNNERRGFFVFYGLIVSSLLFIGVIVLDVRERRKEKKHR